MTKQKPKSYFEGRSWDGRSLGPESLWYQQGLIPLRSTGQYIKNPVRPKGTNPSMPIKGQQPAPKNLTGGDLMFTGGTPYFDERTGQRVSNPTLPTQGKPSMVNAMSWDGRSRGPESLMFQQGLIPNRITGQFAPPVTSNGSFGKGLGLAGSMAPATQESDLIRLLKGLKGNMYQGVVA